MDKIKYFVFSLLLFAFSSLLAVGPDLSSESELSLTSGYVWKSDKEYNRIYGKSIHNALTIDYTRYLHKHFGVGAHIAYWHAKGESHGCDPIKPIWGKDTFWRKGYLIGYEHRSWQYKHRMRQVPMVAYATARIGTTIQGHLSLGTGAVLAHERVGNDKTTHLAPALYVEAGVKARFCDCAHLKASVYWINSHKRMAHNQQRIDFGGKGLKVGLGVSF